MTELNLEVGKTYISGDGDKVYIKTEYKDERLYKFVSGTGITYQINGREIANSEYSGNLISEYTPPAKLPQPATRTPLVHAEQRHDHADGWDIEWLNDSKWVYIEHPTWLPSIQYRRKPEPAPLKPNEVKFIAIFHDGLSENITTGLGNIAGYKGHKAVRIEFNPNDQTLVSAQVVTL